MKKLPRSTNYRKVLGTGIKWVLIAEGLALVGTYAVWRHMNTSQDFRHKMYNYCPVVLESYYWMGETFSSLPTRKLDYKAWGVSKDE